MKVMEAYAGRALPAQVAALLNNDVRCPETGRVFRPRDHGQMLLVPEE